MGTEPEQSKSLENAGKSLLSRVRDQVLVWRLQKLENFSRKISVFPVRSSLYAFKVLGNRREDMQIFTHVWPGWENEVWIIKNNRYESLYEFLDWLKDVNDSHHMFSSGDDSAFTSKALNELQSDWWSSNGKHFSMMLLPGELRNLIYKYTFGQGAVLSVFTRTKGRGRRAREYMKAHLAPDIALMYTNRQIHCEAGAILYNDVTFVVASFDYLAPTLKHPCARHIRKLTLDLDHSDYLRLVGMAQSDQEAVLGVPSEYDHWHSSQFLALAKLNLNKLVFNFRTATDEPKLSYRLRQARHNLLMRYILFSALPHLKGQAVECWGAADDELVKGFRIEIGVARREFLDFSDRNEDPTIEMFQYWWGGDEVQPSKYREEETKKVEEELKRKRADGSLVVISDEAYPGKGGAW